MAMPTRVDSGAAYAALLKEIQDTRALEKRLTLKRREMEKQMPWLGNYKGLVKKGTKIAFEETGASTAKKRKLEDTRTIADMTPKEMAERAEKIQFKNHLNQIRMKVASKKEIPASLLKATMTSGQMLGLRVPEDLVQSITASGLLRNDK